MSCLVSDQCKVETLSAGVGEPAHQGITPIMWRKLHKVVKVHTLGVRRAVM